MLIVTLQQLAHFVVKFLDIFLLMECDIQKYNIRIPARPSTQSAADLATLRATYADQNITEFEREKIPRMREAAKARQSTASSKQTFNNYILDRRGPHDWRESRNATRDFPQVAIIAFIEPRFVNKYRKDLLEKSSAARFLRSAARDLLSQYAKPRQIIKASTKKTATVHRYDFPDAIKTTAIDIPDVDVNNILWELSDACTIAEHLDLLKGEIKKLESLPFALARSDVSLIAPNVKERIDDVHKVHPHSSFHSSC
jgi:hypothetical protein